MAVLEPTLIYTSLQEQEKSLKLLTESLRRQLRALDTAIREAKNPKPNFGRFKSEHQKLQSEFQKLYDSLSRTFDIIMKTIGELSTRFALYNKMDASIIKTEFDCFTKEIVPKVISFYKAFQKIKPDLSAGFKLIYTAASEYDKLKKTIQEELKAIENLHRDYSFSNLTRLRDRLKELQNFAKLDCDLERKIYFTSDAYNKSRSFPVISKKAKLFFMMMMANMSIQKITITSVYRSPANQIRVMLQNLTKGQMRNGYKSPPLKEVQDLLIAIHEQAKAFKKDKSEIYEYAATWCQESEGTSSGMPQALLDRFPNSTFQLGGTLPSAVDQATFAQISPALVTVAPMPDPAVAALAGTAAAIETGSHSSETSLEDLSDTDKLLLLQYLYCLCVAKLVSGRYPHNQNGREVIDVDKETLTAHQRGINNLCAALKTKGIIGFYKFDGQDPALHLEFTP